MATFSVVIPLYNRPREVDELLESLSEQSCKDFDVVVVEDGSLDPGDAECARWSSRMRVRYAYINNRGPAGARNHGVTLCDGRYVIFFDSDCLVPPDYIALAKRFVTANPDVALWGGPDAAHTSFTPIQKAISYAMTSPLSTGGIRGGSERADKFYPRTFNMGVRRDVFEAVGGFADMRYGEDVDFSMRIVEGGYVVRLQRDLFVYHKRRTRLREFYRQVQHSGKARVALSRRHKGTLRAVHALPAVGVVLLVIAVSGVWRAYSLAVIVAGGCYCVGVLAHASVLLRSFRLGWLSMLACCVQLLGYGVGFLKGIFTR